MIIGFSDTASMDHLLTIIWSLMAISAPLSTVFPELAIFSSHGKRQRGNHIFMISKYHFKIMYQVGIVTGFIVLVIYWLKLVDTQNTSKYLSLVLFLIQVSRRLWESYHITVNGTSTMHLGGLIVGILHYILVPLTLVLSDYSYSPSISCIAVAIVIFTLSNYFQYKHHIILYDLKMSSMKSKTTINHGLPRGMLFRYVCCPHYLLETLVYFSFYMLQVNSFARLSMLLWVISNLSVVAHENLQWYRQEFPSEFIHQAKSWKRIFPFIW